MNIGDGLTIQTRSVNGKVSTGIFLTPSNVGKEPKTKFNYKSKTVKYPIRSRIEPTQTTQKTGYGNNAKGDRPANKVTRSQETRPNGDVHKKQIVPKKSEETESDNLDAENRRPKREVAGNNASRLRSEKYQKKPNIVEGKKMKNIKNPGVPDELENVNTKFVTLTQDQLNTILSLVKTKHDIDVSTVLTDGDMDPKDDSTQLDDHESDKTVEQKDGERVEPDSVPGLDLGTKTEGEPDTKAEGRSTKTEKIPNHSKKQKRKSKEVSETKKGASGKDGEKDENSQKDVEEDDGTQEDMKGTSGYDACGALGGFGAREREKEKIEAKRQEWIKGLVEQVKQTEQMREERKQQRKGSERQLEIGKNNQEKENIEIARDPPSDAAEKKLKKPKQPVRSAPPSAKMSARAHKNAASIQQNESTPMRKSQESLPAAIRSSFFMGEAVPREHAFSATKREQQRRWKEELDKQRLEQNRRREEEKQRQMRRAPDAEETAWTRHFDTMLPAKSSPPAENPAHNTPERENVVPFPSAGGSDIRSASDSQIENPTMISQETITPRESAGMSLMNNIYRGEHTTAAPGGGSTNYDQQKSSYLRTMTSLLDPAQIEALEVKRKKQEEHRRAIAAQVEERKRKKEEEQNLQKRLEMEEDMRLAAERDALAQKNEIERMKHQMRENIREQKTQQLYHQMQEAQESALRDKLSQREQQLRNRGHDTSRLEKTHQITLETNKKVVDSGNQPAQASQTSIMGTSSVHVPVMNLPPQTYTANTTPRQAFVTVDERSPVSVTADTGSGPIKLEITLNKQPNQSDVVETGVQTDVAKEFTGRLILDSDQETEYMPLPQVKTKKTRPQKGDEKKGDKRNAKHSLQKYEKNLEKQYDRYSRTTRNQMNVNNGNANNANQTSPVPEGGNAKQRKNERKPQWGVGPKKKEFVPASKRYVDNAKWQRKHEANVRRREEQLLEQQALNNPERLREIASQMREKDDSPTGGRSSPPVPTIAHRMDNANNGNRRTRSHSPQKRDVHDHRSRSPPVPARRWQKEQPARRGQKDPDRKADRPESVVSATTEQAKYRGSKHTRESPIPQTNDFVEYRRTSTILNPHQVDSRPVSGAEHLAAGGSKDNPHPRQHATHSDHHDPLYNPNMVKQRDRQEQILREISILRQGLLLKQREVASYPATMTHSIAAMPQTSLVLAGGGNLPERTNDTPLM